MDTLYTFWGNITHYKAESVHFLGLMNSATKIITTVIMSITCTISIGSIISIMSTMSMIRIINIIGISRNISLIRLLSNY